MSDDLPVEETRRGVRGARERVTDGAGDAVGEHAWESLRGWELLLAVSILTPAVFVLLTERPGAEKAVILTLLAALAPLYLFFGRPAIVVEDVRRGAVYVALLVVVFSAAVVLEQSVTFALFGLCPQCFMALPTRRALIAVAAMLFAPTVRFLADRQVDGLFNYLTLAMILVFFAGVFGVWLEKIMQQSRERAELIRQLADSRAEVARLSAERGALAERERLAGEIHDTLAQGFTSIIMLLQAAQSQRDPSRHLELAVRTARENLAEARALVAALAPAPLDGSSLPDALGRLAARLGEEAGLAVSFETRGTPPRLPPPVEVVLIRAAQEGLANVRRHARARSVRVLLEYGGHDVVLRIEDDGVGFRPSAPASGYGLRAMRNRVEQAGGAVRVGARPEGGTTLEVVMPVTPAEDATDLEPIGGT
ncbi:sensor histidine kinase [Thermostaphylospora chromogena]|uniref:Oxygen sensor histidine kinase NreB n=1 Tax=Thermostaphylospora chromogena TaxID=35622 RepID=A0A1H1F1B7_9ACTN|nr:sensor histidine kinase [Thermostaphylospora chromogena]SDQ94698.1 Signal transduction histidine kinase [Thermostaphylospora chromogena]